MNLKYSFLLILLILPCFIASDENYPQEFEQKADSLIDLTETNFDQNVFSGDNDRWFVMFYDRSCPDCQDTTSLFNELAKALGGKVKIGRVDCDANPGLRDRYSIQAIPTFLYFYKDEIHQYEGDKTVEAWTEFANEGFPKTENKESEDIKTFEGEAHSLVDQNQENSEYIIRQHELLLELTDKNFDSQVKNGDRWFDRWFVMFYVPWCPHSQNAVPVFEELANSLQNQLNFGKVDCDTEDTLREKYSIQAYPTFLYFYKGEIRQYEGDRTVEAWTEFVNNGYKKVGTIEPQEAKAVEENSTPVNSEEILSEETYLSENQLLENLENITQQPPVQESSLPVNVQWKDDSLIELSDINFNYKVLSGFGKWFIMFYNPWCPVCRETMPTFIQLAKSLQGEVSVGRVDADANPYIRTRYGIQGHPTFLYLDKKEPSKYEGENTVEAWTEFVKNGGVKKIIEENIAPEEQQPENQYNITQQPGISQPESIDYLVQQPRVEARPELPQNVTQQLPVEERPQVERAEHIPQLPENVENITQEFPDQGRPQPETPVNIPQLPENVENITQQLPTEGVPQPENITQQFPDQVRPQPQSPENITHQVPVQERPHPETAENTTQQFPDQVRPRPETPVNIPQLPENTENITQQFPDQGIPQPESPENVTQQLPVQERPQVERAENISELPESTENITQQIPVQERPQPPVNIPQLESPDFTQQIPVQERPQPGTAENITRQFPAQGIPQPEIPENVTQQLPVQERPQVERAENISELPESTENITQQILVQERTQPETPVNIPQLPETTENITQQRPNEGVPQPESSENVTQQLPVKERPQVERAENISMLPENAENITQQLPNQGILQPESPENITQPIPVQEKLQPETLEGALIDLTEANFDSNVHSDENRKWFVMFYTPWCPHCNEAMSTFGELANSLRDQVSIGRVDCDENPGLRDRFSIQAYPIFLYFYKGEIHQYKGPREIEAWTEFATTHYRYTDIQAPDEDKIIERDTTPLNRNETLAAPPQIPEVTEEKIDSLIELCDDDFDSRVFSNVEEKWFVMFYDPSCPRCQEAMPTFGELANSLNGRVRVAVVDCDANPGLASKYNIQDHPTFLLFYQGETHQYDGLRTIEAWTDFATTDYKSTEAPVSETETVIERDSAPFYLNESVVPPQEITEEKTDSLIDLCDDDFESNVFSQDKEKWFVMFYAPWCPHCHDAMPAFGDFANSLKNQVSVARVDCEANPGLRDQYSIQGYPTFLFFYKGEIHQYEGPRTVEAWTEFVTRDYKSTETQTPEEVKDIEKDSSPIPSEPQHVPQEKNPIIPAEETGSLIDLNKDNFNTQVFANEDDKWMIMFYAPWCPHCKHAMPAFKELAKVVNGHAKVGRVDCDANPELRTRFAIEGYPTFLFFSDGDVRKFEGARTIEAWSNFVDEGYKKVKAIEENVHAITEEIRHTTKSFELTPVVMIIGGALIGAVLLFCFLAITRRKDEDTTIRHAQLEGTDISDDSRIYMD